MLTAARKLTIEEYLEQEARSLEKHEYWDGKIKPMAGGSAVHNQLVMTIGAEILMAIRRQDKVFNLYSSDMKIWIETFRLFVYPDAVTVAEGPAFFEGRRDIITNPLLVVEVTSASTQAYDLNGKFEQYRSIPSFREYLLVSQERRHVSRYFREEKDLWRTSDYFDLQARIPLQSMGVEISMEGIYSGVQLEG